LSTTVLTIGVIAIDVGTLTIKPIMNARIHVSKKWGTKPRFIEVSVKDMEKDMPNDIRTANNITEYFLFIFIAIILAVQDYKDVMIRD